MMSELSGHATTSAVQEVNQRDKNARYPALRWVILAVTIATVAALPLKLIDDPASARAAAVAGVCLALWLSESVPPFVPTLALWLLVPLALRQHGEDFALPRVLAWSAEPVLALFLGGFALGAAARKYGLDARLAALALRLSGGRRLAVMSLVALTTAFLSMWMSNIAAAAMMIAAVAPLFAGAREEDTFRRAVLLSVAMGANFGGIATPVGTGPNAIAIAAASRQHAVTFLDWMIFATPLALGLLAWAVVLLAVRFRVGGEMPPSDAAGHRQAKPLPHGSRAVLLIFALTLAAWLTESCHGASSPLVALAATVALFGSGLLNRGDLAGLDWSTLLLIAGGIGLGNLLEKSGLVSAGAFLLAWDGSPAILRVFVLCFASAMLSALMSNTAAVTMLVPVAAAFDPSPSTAILIAVSASLGVPFVISTPPNAMVYGEGGVKASDLLLPGLVLMILGCLLVSLTGPYVLRTVGIP